MLMSAAAAAALWSRFESGRRHASLVEPRERQLLSKQTRTRTEPKPKQLADFTGKSCLLLRARRLITLFPNPRRRFSNSDSGETLGGAQAPGAAVWRHAKAEADAEAEECHSRTLCESQSEAGGFN